MSTQEIGSSASMADNEVCKGVSLVDSQMGAGVGSKAFMVGTSCLTSSLPGIGVLMVLLTCSGLLAFFMGTTEKQLGSGCFLTLLVKVG